METLSTREEAMLASVQRNAPFARLHLFTHNLGPQAQDLITRNSRGIQQHQLEELPFDLSISGSRSPSVGRYRKEGFDRFTADRVCHIYGFRYHPYLPVSLTTKYSSSPDSQECDRLFSSVKWSKFRRMLTDTRFSVNDQRHVITQLRGMYGHIFEPWIGPSHCQSWAWVDTDVVFGDMASWLDETSSIRGEKNFFFKDLDIWTAVDPDGYDAIRPHSQFTLFRQAKNPRVNDVWKYSREFGDFYNPSTSDFQRLDTLARFLVR